MTEETNEIETNTETQKAAGLLVKSESVEDTIRKSIDELKNNQEETEEKADDNQDPIPQERKSLEEVPGIAPSKKKKGKKTAEIATETDSEEEHIPTPQRFLAENKEWFEAQPIQAKKELARMVKDQEAYFTKHNQELQREKEIVSGIRQTVDHYLPKWNLKGIPNAAVAVAELCAANDRLLQDPIGGLDELIARMGITPEQYLQYSQAKRNNPNAQQYQPQKQQQNNSQNIQSGYLTETQFRQILETDRISSQIENELIAVRDEKDSNGKYKHPRLHDQGIWQVFEPLIKARMATHPNESYGVACKAVYANIYGTNGSPSQTQQRLPNEDKLQRAKLAAQSIKGRGGKFEDEEEEVPDKLEDAIRYSMRQLGSQSV